MPLSPSVDMAVSPASSGWPLTHALDPHCHILLRQQGAEPLCSPECFQRAAHGRIVIHGSFSKIFTPGHDTRKWW